MMPVITAAIAAGPAPDSESGWALRSRAFKRTSARDLGYRFIFANSPLKNTGNELMLTEADMDSENWPSPAVRHPSLIRIL